MDCGANYDVIVVGSGHAGIEAALAAARLGCRTAMFTINVDNIGLMPCNPSIGGPAKGQIVGEIDALGGEMGRAADVTHIQIKVLNRSRGPAVQCLRSQNDKKEYNLYMKRVIMDHDLIDVKQAHISRLIIEDNIVKGVVTQLGKEYRAKTTVITTGTFMKGLMHIGLQSFSGGRVGEMSAETLSDSLTPYLKMGRLKTGTPPRLDRKSIDFDSLESNSGDPECLRFSFRTPYHERFKDQVDCHLTTTTPDTHKIIMDNLDRSPMFQGQIEGSGPRYCPSIEDKVVRFCDKDGHHIFLEPEGIDSQEIYAQGLNTSLPEDVQEAFLKTMPGLENVKVIKPGYAVEYDFFYPNQLFPTLETRPLKNLYLAGQINGTSGYEEAAGQGIVAGINAGLRAQDKEPFILKREDSYIGTMIDDLITKEILEPYRMLTSRSEYRLILRQDNATSRLSERAYDAGLLGDEDIAIIREQHQQLRDMLRYFKKTSVTDEVAKSFSLGQKIRLQEFVKRTDVSCETLMKAGLLEDTFEVRHVASKAIVELKYEGYISKQQQDIEKLKSLDSRHIPDHLDFRRIQGLRTESYEKFETYKPKTIYDAKRIAGINPADIMLVASYLERTGV